MQVVPSKGCKTLLKIRLPSPNSPAKSFLIWALVTNWAMILTTLATKTTKPTAAMRMKTSQTVRVKMTVMKTRLKAHPNKTKMNSKTLPKHSCPWMTAQSLRWQKKLICLRVRPRWSHPRRNQYQMQILIILFIQRTTMKKLAQKI